MATLMNVSSIEISENGNSDAILLRRGIYALLISSTDWGTANATLQFATQTGEFQDVLNGSDEAVVISANYNKKIYGGLRYRLVVADIEDPIILEVEQLNIE